MDTVVSVSAYGPADVASEAIGRAFEAMRRIDALASFHRADSALHRFNAQRSLVPSPELAAIFRQASASAALSGGVFDPTFAVLHRIYGFYDQKGRLPSDDEIARTLPLIGWSRMVVEREGAFTLASGALVDLGGIAGGFAVEAAAQAMRTASCTAFFIDDGGDLWMEGRKPNGRPWRVAVLDPRTNGTLAVIESEQPVAISTSGDYERFVEVDGRRYGHIMDPRTGRPPTYHRSVTVIASTPIAHSTQNMEPCGFCQAHASGMAETMQPNSVK